MMISSPIAPHILAASTPAMFQTSETSEVELMVRNLEAPPPRRGGVAHFRDLTFQGEDVKYIRRLKSTGKLATQRKHLRPLREVMRSSNVEIQSEQSGTDACDGHGATGVDGTMVDAPVIWPIKLSVEQREDERV